MKLPGPRAGARLSVTQKEVPFSFWPTRKAAQGPAPLQSILFSLDPWAILEQVVQTKCPPASKSEALACLSQARDFFANATSPGVIASRPLTLYYCLMNLAKALGLTRGLHASFNHAQHGLSEQLRPPGVELTDAYLRAFPSPNAGGVLQNFAELQRALTGKTLPAQIDLDVPKLLPQIVPGHRLWAQASGQDERFVSIHDIQFWNSTKKKEIWIRLYFVSDDLKRLGVTQKRLLAESGLSQMFRAVKCNEKAESRPLVCLEQVVPTTYGGYPSTALNSLATKLKSTCWVTVSTVKPYRRYYVYLCPPAEKVSVLPQLLSIYAISYYLGSITRYRPQQFDSIVQSAFGPRVQDFITGQPLQFLYLIASEFAEQDVTKPAIL